MGARITRFVVGLAIFGGCRECRQSLRDSASPGGAAGTREERNGLAISSGP
jgi:hypothetical protein